MSDKQPTQLKTEPLPDEDRSNIKQPTQLKHLNPNEISKPLWIKISGSGFISLIKDVNDNLDNKDYKTKVGDNNYNLKTAKKILLEITTKKNNKNEARKLYKGLIKPNVDVLMLVKGRGKNKTNNILNILIIQNQVFWRVSIFTTKMCLKRHSMKEVFLREQY